MKSNPPSMKLGINKINFMLDSYYVVLANEEVLKRVGAKIGNIMMEDVTLMTAYYFDIDNKAKMTILSGNILNTISSTFKEQSISVSNTEFVKQALYVFNGGFLFLGIFLGSLLIMATILNIYYKQVSEGYDDKKLFAIMQKVGMSLDEVKKSIGSQVLTVFFLPIITATIHCIFAFPLIYRVLIMFGLTDMPYFAICMAITIIIFMLFYVIVYVLTSKTYYKIVKQD